MTRKGIKWEPSKPIKYGDNLVSSSTFKNVKPFQPSYEKNECINMYHLLGWEYGRMWFTEVNTYKKYVYSKEATGKNRVFKRQMAMNPKSKK